MERWIECNIPPESKEMIRLGIAEEIDECWRLDIDEYKWTVHLHYIGDKCFGQMVHITIKKVNLRELAKNPFKALRYSEEPTYKEKMRILKDRGKYKELALEVFPTEENLVDMANLYHIWEFEKDKFPFINLSAFKEITEWESITAGRIKAMYAMKTEKTQWGRIAYICLKSEDGRELKWKEKQALKNEIVGNITAIELICNDGNNFNYSCLICLPLNFHLNFGLMGGVC